MKKKIRFSILIKIILITLLVVKNNSIMIRNHCENIEGIGSPANMIHEYFKQIYHNLYNKSEEKPLELLSISDQKEDNEVFRFIFRVTLNEIYYYIGILSIISKKEIKKVDPLSYIVRYIQSKEVRDVERFLGVYDINLKNDLTCPFDLKTEFWNFVRKKPIKNVLIFEKKKKKFEEKKNIGLQKTYKDLLNKLLKRKNSGNKKQFIKKSNMKKKSSRYSLGTVLSGTGKNKIMNPIIKKNEIISKTNNSKFTKNSYHPGLIQNDYNLQKNYKIKTNSYNNYNLAALQILIDKQKAEIQTLQSQNFYIYD